MAKSPQYLLELRLADTKIDRGPAVGMGTLDRGRFKRISDLGRRPRSIYRGKIHG